MVYVFVAKDELNGKLKQLQLEIDYMQNQLDIEKKRSGMFENLYLSLVNNPEKQQNAFNVTFFNCMHILASSVKVNMSELLKSANFTFLDEASRYIKDYQEIMENLTKDSKFTEYFQNVWDDLKKNIDSTDVKSYFEKVGLAFNQLQDAMKQQWKDFSDSASSEATSDAESKPEEQASLTKTIGKTVNKAMSKVKEFSKKVIKEHKETIKSIKDSVKQLKNEVHEKWNKIAGRKNEKIQKNEKRFKHEDEKDTSDEVIYDEYEPNIEKWIHQYQDHNPKQFSPSHWAAVFNDLEESPVHDKKIDRVHKDTQSDHMDNNEELELGMNPEELLHDSFFEGNHRRWKKYQKTFKKILGRIQKLNEDSLVTLDDDDIEDLYDDLDDLMDDLEDKEISEKLKTWLTCQLRWWKSRFHRKHRDQDLMKGCGNELMRWQLRVFCNEAFGKRGHHAVDSVQCQSLWQKTQATTGDKNKRQCHSDKKHGARSENPHKTHFMHPHPDYLFQDSNTTTADNSGWYFRRAQDRDDHLVDATWWFKRKAGRYHMMKSNQDDPTWYFSRVHDREYHHHPTGWFFKRASERQQRHHWVRGAGRHRRHG